MRGPDVSAGAPPPRDSRHRGPAWGVAAGAAALVLAVWVSLRLSQAPPDTDAFGARPSASPSAPLAVVEPELGGGLGGFRPDAWYLPDDSTLGFVEIPQGPFVMGSDPGVDPLAFDIEWWGAGRVQGTVHVDAFYLGRYEVTVAQYTAFVRESGYRRGDARALRAPPNHPVAHVSWPDAVAYTRWLDEALRSSDGAPWQLLALLERGWRVRLPTEAQWEKAARGTDGRVYPWGNEPRPDRANFRARSTSPVGSFPCPECPYPLSDMSGNVWEWTRSPYQTYPYDPDDDHAGLDAEALWIMRGGGFADSEQFVRAANRGGADPGARRPFIGFRVALTRD